MIIKDMTLVTIASDEAKEFLDAFIGENRGTITALIQEKLKTGEVVERALAKSLIKVDSNQSQGVIVDVERMSIAQKLRILGRILGRRKITFSETICGQRIILDVRVLALN